MGYYIRVLGTSTEVPTFAELQEAVKPATLEITEGLAGTWDSLLLRHRSGEEIACIERNPVIEGELGFDELQELIDEVGDCEPKTAARWLQSYLPRVKAIYAFQFLEGIEMDGGYQALHKLYGKIWETAGGILQADGEGFSNEDGCTIVWQFSEDVEGPWNVGVLDRAGKWNNYEIDLGDKAQREAFLRGEVSPGAKPFIAHSKHSA
jgi:hypothetical protein